MVEPVIYNFTNIIEQQQAIAPQTYEGFDFSRTPERFRSQLSENSILRKNPRVQAMLADPERVELFRQLTLMGDPVADAFAALFPELGFRQARAMLDVAVEKGIDAVDDAPEELRRFMATMEHVPEWLDWDKIEYANRKLRVGNAVFSEMATRAAFMMTYVNGYQGLPMLITGALSGEAAGRRILETTSTLRLAILPGALERDGEAFKSACKVRVMHAMVRYNLLHNSKVWDTSVYGVPIPQVDQMGAALVPVYMLAQRALKRNGRFTRAEASIVELFRYMAYLLGLHQQFLSDDPEEIVSTWNMVQATLPHKFDERGLKLNEATLNAWLRKEHGPLDKTIHWLDQRATRVLYQALVGRKAARQMQAEPHVLDVVCLGLWGMPLALKYAGLKALARLGADDWVDRYAVKEIRRQLRLDVNEVAYKTDAGEYQTEL